MSEHIYTDNSACRVCMNCVFYCHSDARCYNNAAPWTHGKGNVSPYQAACEEYTKKGADHE